MKTTHPYLNFNGNTEQAFEHYRTVFGGEFDGVVRYRDAGGDAMGLTGADLDRIMHIALPIGGHTILMGTDVLESRGQAVATGTNTYIYLETDSTDEAERLFGGLSAGGTVEMPLQRADWAELFGACADRFGIQWMVNYTGAVRFSYAPAG
jgi:PhnB protein